MFWDDTKSEINRLDTLLKKSITGLQDSNDEIRNKLTKIGRELDGVYYPHRHDPGLIKRVDYLEYENEKLKAIVAELCDYVYRENK